VIKKENDRWNKEKEKEDMQPADVLIPMFTDLNNEILDIDYELKAIISCTTREGRILLQALVLT